MAPGSGPCNTRLLAHSTVMTTMGIHVEIVDMRPWSWVLRLLLLLLRGFVENVTSAVKLAICVGIALRQRVKGSRSRQKTPEACTECEAYAFC